MRNTSVNGVFEPSLSFIGYGDRGSRAITHRKMSKQLRHIACPEDLVNGRKVRSALLVAEVRRENAASHAFSSQKFASSTRRT